MDTTNQNLKRLLNLATEFEFAGKIYKVKEATLKQRAEFATWVEMRAWEAVERMRLNSDDESSLSTIKANIAGEIAAGKYEWGGEYVNIAMRTTTGCKHLLYIMMHSEDVGITEEIVSEIYDARLKEVDKLLAEVREDPKAFAEMVGSVIGEV